MNISSILSSPFFLNGNKLDKIVKNYPDYSFSDINAAIEDLYEWVYTQYGSGIYSVNCKINSKHIAFVQAYSNVYGYVILGGYSRSHLLCSNLNNGTWAHNKILLTSDLVTKQYSTNDVISLLEGVNILDYTRGWANNYISYFHIVFSNNTSVINPWTNFISIPFRSTKETVTILNNVEKEVYIPSNSYKIKAMGSIPIGTHSFDLTVPLV